MLDWKSLSTLLDLAWAEDIGSGDVTTLATVPSDLKGRGRILAKSPGRIAGLSVVEYVFQTLPRIHAPLSDMNSRLSFTPFVLDGESITANTVIAEVSGYIAPILVGERTALNFLQRLSGVSTLTAQMVEAVSHTSAQIIDTRKTTAGWRSLQKYAVRMGGGQNHRMGLFDGILIKDNHIVAAGGICSAIEKAKTVGSHTLKIEVEVKCLAQIPECLDAGADIILLDNMSNGDMTSAVNMIKGKALTEASGGITLESVVDVAQTGVNLISVGALTHSALPLDISLDLELN